jgi:malto-oligosyltrehalose synthase/4-alpha-glucanotransferase
MFNPVSTYRIQFHKDFTFKSLEKIIPYLHELGVNTIYASPIFKAVPGSNHGYDVLDPHTINPEIGTLDELRKLSKKLKDLNINWLQDIVPNHMAFHPENAWLMDVLEKGKESEFSNFFDIIWDVPAFNDKLMVPFLGDRPEKLIEDKQLCIAYQNDGFKLVYSEQVYPLNLSSSVSLLRGKNNPEILKEALDSKSIDEFKNALSEVYSNTEVTKYIKSAVDSANADPELLLQLVNGQYYQLSYWKESDTVINYRRFFTVNSLICLNMQHQHVFDYYHQFIKELLAEDIIQGVRVDHIDGLFDPTTYLERLRHLTGPDTYIIVEKILEEGEQFPAEWPVEGNTGYDFLAMVNNLFTTADNRKVFADFYKKLIGNNQPVTKSILQKKADILFKHMAGEHENLYRLFVDLKLAETAPENSVGSDQIKAAIGDFLIHCPVYRYYGNKFPLNGEEQAAVAGILEAVAQSKPELKPATKLLADIWLNAIDNEEHNDKTLYFYQRCLQFAGPLMAKGVEDTLMYTNNLFIGHNEVGDSPAAFGLNVSQFHQLMMQRQQASPLSINATSTHDTKRGEDVRARLNVLTDIGEEWIKAVSNWQKQNATLKQNNIPDTNDEYLIYQTLVGFYPMQGESADNVKERLQAYLTKALREAKTHTQWAEPNEVYESGTLAFAEALLDQQGRFWKSFVQFQTKVADKAVINSLAQVLLKFTCPGVPDVYQGCELWDFSLVDPDNRRPVDYNARLTKINEDKSFVDLWDERSNGDIKLRLTQLLNRLRRDNPDVFAKGNYLPLEVKGKYRRNLIAFARNYLQQWIVVIAPIGLAAADISKKGGFDWKDTIILLPDDAPLQWQSLFGGQPSVFNNELPVKTVLKKLPFGLLKSSTSNTKRSAGLIMHITSLPSDFGVGDMGPEARAFADFLSRANQKYWQLLPLNPTGPVAYYSPYSAYSSMAGNVLLISPEDLSSDGLLTAEELETCKVAAGKGVNFDEALPNKSALFSIAFKHFKQDGPDPDQLAFADFCEKEAYWLDDYALYEVLKTSQANKPWYEWPEQYKCRDVKALKAFSQDNQESLEQTKWLQFVFYKQWTGLKNYGNQLGIKFFGDLPFYVNYDSADVWTHSEIFKLDDNKEISGIGGVPPDYFNADGQLWGMPVYDWDALAKTNYHWWVDRIRKNREFFDYIRLDHFRAFYDFWEVPAGETTAINGSWKAGPGTALFNVFEKELGDLPFIAEDLGDVSPGVYTLRDELGLPGMNLLQYAFGTDMPVSVHAPHNHRNHSVTYTGTHDNNTTIGWFKENTSKEEQKNLNEYMRVKVNARNVHNIMIELCYASVSELAILPLQDVLGLDESGRMNVPASKEGNWSWQLQRGALNEKIEHQLRCLVRKFNR